MSLIIGFFLIKERTVYFSKLTILVFLFLGSLFISLQIFQSNWSHLGLFVISYFLTGYLVASSLTKDILLSLYRVCVGVFFILAVWAILQFLTGEGLIHNFNYRASTIFSTPNSYAAATNLVLLPLISSYLYSKGDRYIYVAILMLFAGLICTQSRGGWIAFVFSLILIIVLISNCKEVFNKRLLVNVVIGFISTIFLLFIIKMSLSPIEARPEAIIPFKSASSSGIHRLELFRVAIVNMLENPWFGVGYFNYHYYLHRDMLSHVNATTLFTHNDYLQIGLEIGFIGLGLLILKILYVFQSGINALSALRDNDRNILICCLGSLSSFFIHALVDYVMYVPVLMLMSGMFIATVNRFTLVNDKIKLDSIKECLVKLNNIIRPKTVKFIFGLIILSILFQPALAQICHIAAKRDLENHDYERAIKLFELARQFAPYYMGYYLTEANYWKSEVENTLNKEAATRAEQLYIRAIEVNRFDPYSRLELSLLHRDYAFLLIKPADKKTIINWFGYIYELRPHYKRLNAEYVKTLISYGQLEKAKNIVMEYNKTYPNSDTFGDLQGEVWP